MATHNPVIAVATKQPANNTGDMIVIDRQPDVKLVLMLLTDGAATALLLE
jgi:hypothetical protein